MITDDENILSVNWMTAVFHVFVYTDKKERERERPCKQDLNNKHKHVRWNFVSSFVVTTDFNFPVDSTIIFELKNSRRNNTRIPITWLLIEINRHSLRMKG